MDINLELAIYKCYTVMLERFCREHASRATVDVIIHDMWLSAVEYALDAFAEGENKDDPQEDKTSVYH